MTVTPKKQEENINQPVKQEPPAYMLSSIDYQQIFQLAKEVATGLQTLINNNMGTWTPNIPLFNALTRLLEDPQRPMTKEHSLEFSKMLGLMIGHECRALGIPQEIQEFFLDCLIKNQQLKADAVEIPVI